jgi:hypothetical protein
MTPWTGDQPVAGPKPTQDNTNIKQTLINIMTWVGFEPMIPVLERAKTFRALDRTVNLKDLSTALRSASALEPVYIHLTTSMLLKYYKLISGNSWLV